MGLSLVASRPAGLLILLGSLSGSGAVLGACIAIAVNVGITW